MPVQRRWVNRLKWDASSITVGIALEDEFPRHESLPPATFPIFLHSRSFEFINLEVYCNTAPAVIYSTPLLCIMAHTLQWVITSITLMFPKFRSLISNFRDQRWLLSVWHLEFWPSLFLRYDYLPGFTFQVLERMTVNILLWVLLRDQSFEILLTWLSSDHRCLRKNKMRNWELHSSPANK